MNQRYLCAKRQALVTQRCKFARPLQTNLELLHAMAHTSTFVRHGEDWEGSRRGASSIFEKEPNSCAHRYEEEMCFDPSRTGEPRRRVSDAEEAGEEPW